MPGQNVVDSLLHCLDDHRQAQGFVSKVCPVMHRLPGQATAQEPAIAFDNADPSGDVVQQLVAAAKGCRGMVDP
jgi:hypothetical protein